MDQKVRDQEVLRANRELAAYFRGRRTEREARGALKIIKAFIRDRERTNPAKRRPLPVGASSATRDDLKPLRRPRLSSRRMASGAVKPGAGSRADAGSPSAPPKAASTLQPSKAEPVPSKKD